MPRLVDLGIKRSRAERLALLARADEFGVEVPPGRLGPFSFSWSALKGGTGHVKFRNLIAATIIRSADGWGLSIRDEVPERADVLISRALLDALDICDEIGRAKRNIIPDTPDDYCSRITSNGVYDLTGWAREDARLAVLGLADARPGEAFIGSSRSRFEQSGYPDSITVTGAKPVTVIISARAGEPVHVRSRTGDRTISEPILRDWMTQGLERTRAAHAGPGEAFEELRNAALADDVSLEFFWMASELGKRVINEDRAPIRRDFGPFSVSMNEKGFITHSHMGVIYAWGAAGPNLSTDPDLVNKERALIGLPSIQDEPLRWGLRAGVAALLGQDIDSFAIPDENDMNDEALRLGL